MPIQKPSAQIQWKERNFPLVVIAENLHSPSNIGMITRLCEAFGVKTLYLSGPYSNTHSEKFRKTARAAENYLTIITSEDTVSVMQALRAQHYQIIALEITKDSRSIRSLTVKKSAPIAVIVGSERHGIAPLTLKTVDDAYHIEQYGKTGSLNVSTALAIALHEISAKYMGM